MHASYNASYIAAMSQFWIKILLLCMTDNNYVSGRKDKRQNKWYNNKDKVKQKKKRK